MHRGVTDHRRLFAWTVVVAVLAALPHLHGALTNEWAFDDYRFIVRNPHVTAPESWVAFFTDPHTTDPLSPTGIVRPLRTLEFALDHALFGLSPRAFHLHGLAWLALATALLFRWLAALSLPRTAAAFGALVWAVHPMQTEAVAWVSSRGDVAMAACVFGSLLAATRSEGRDRWMAISLLLAGMAALYKETGVVVPALIVLTRLVVPPPGRERGRFGVALRSSLPWWGLAGAYLGYRSLVMVGGMDHVTTHAFAGGTHGALATMSCGFTAYLTMALLPVRPALDWYLPVRTSFAEPEALLSMLLHVGLAVTALRTMRTRPVVALAIGLFYVPLTPVSNWPIYLGIPTAERFLHLPLAGLGLVAGVSLARLGRATWPAAGAILVALSVGTVTRTADWYDDTTIWPATLATVDSPRAFDYAAAEELKAGNALLTRVATEELSEERVEELRARATAHFESSLEHAQAAIAKWHAIERVERSTSFVVVQAFVNAASASWRLGRAAEAGRYAEAALAIGEDLFPQPHYTRALAVLGEGRGAAAYRSMARARELGFDDPEPEFAWIFRRAAEACEARGELELAAAALDAAIEVGAKGEETGLARAARARLQQLVAREEVAHAARGVWEQARFEAARGRIAVAEALIPRVGELPPEQRVAWSIARHEARGTVEGWNAALESLRSLPEGTGGLERILAEARCLTELGRHTQAAVLYRRLLSSDAPSVDEDLRRQLTRSLHRAEFDPFASVDWMR